MKAKMILKKGMVFLFAMVMVLTGIFSLGVMAASGLEGAYISPKSKMGLQYANNFSRDVSKSQVSVPNFMADSDTNSEEPNKSFNAQQVAAGNSDAGQKWRGFAAYAKNHDPSDFWVKYKNVTTANGKSVDLKIEVTDWKTQNDESKPLPSNGDMFGHDNNSAHLGYAIGFSYKKTGVVMFSGFKWVKFKYTFLYNGTNTKAPFTGFATFQDIDQNQYVTITDGTECISKASYIGGSDGNTWCEPDGWTYKAIKDQNASSDMGKDTFNKTCISLYVKDMTDMSIKYGWTGHTAIAYFDLAPWAMNSFEDNANPDVPKKLIQSGSSWISNYAILIILFLMAVCLLILTVIGYWGVFCKAGEKGWKVLIPFYNEYLLFKIAWKPSICLFKWLCLFLYEVVSVTLNAGVLLDTLQFALPSIAFGLTVTLYYSLSRAFGHGFGYTVGIMFLPFIFVLLLGVGRSRYTRPDKYRDKF